MTVQTTLQCPHCKADNTPGAAFCAACGKALPMAGSGPKIVSGDALPASAAGAKLVGDELIKQTKSAANALLAVGIIEIILGGILIAIAQSNHAASAGSASSLR